ncbi:CapA family protein [Chondromyces apiculatus]|uniref:Capsule synthesis protein CapA domain-containing protein n=1 Tax=Chondromyces apiculatus DSM 436 TaxID=1192034 RepID=A0A017TD94_9BACT|nr:CapA family protein [Chondromyces apiculatus]EYF06795.1 Hypothetical protein CAP_1492 [Chondromyces apiculatus DSM 436]
MRVEIGKVAVVLAVGVAGAACAESSAAPVRAEPEHAREAAVHEPTAGERGEPSPEATGAASTTSTAATAGARRSARAAEERGPAATSAKEGVVRLSAVGDCTLGTELRSRWGQGSFHMEMQARGGDLSYPFSGVAPVFAQDDLTIANLETTLTSREPSGPPRGLQFRGDPGWARMLVLGGVEVVSVANNHANDLGPRGFTDTLQALNEVGVGAFGFGHVDRRVVQGVEVVNLGYTGGDPSLVMRDMARSVKQHKRPDNLVIVSFHWGGEGVYQPNGDQILLGHGAVDAGADLVLGHHPHVMQGIERYRGREIVYSLGNFVFGGHSNPEDKDTFIYQATFALQAGQVSQTGSTAIPARMSSVTDRNDYRPVVLEGAEGERVLGKLQELSARLASPQ